MDSKFIGGLLLIIGTSIGAGMLGLPIAAAQLGFMGSLILLFSCWLVMTAGALLILEVNLWLPQNSNLISMAKATLGPMGEIIAWISYLLLLYSLLCAYIAGGSDLFHNLLLASHLDFPLWLSAIAFTVIFGLIVYIGIRAVDYVNRGLMFFKFATYLLLIILLGLFVKWDQLLSGNLYYLASATTFTVTMTSFGYATIIPSLRVYFQGDVKKLKRAIIIGSAIPLILYIFWDAVIMGIIPLTGENSLQKLSESSNSVSGLMSTINHFVHYGPTSFILKIFLSISVLTSFLGVSLCLTDFFADGFRLKKKGIGNLIIFSVTFLPSLLIVIFFPNVFIGALSYAGIYCLMLLVLLPAYMAFNGRYRKKMAQGFQVAGGKVFLIFLILFSLFLIAKGLIR